MQAVEVYKGKFIAYAHGNFIFDQMWSYETRVGVIGKYTFYDDTLVGVEFTPTLIQNYAQPVPLEGAERQAVLDGMKAASEELAAGCGDDAGLANCAKPADWRHGPGPMPNLSDTGETCRRNSIIPLDAFVIAASSGSPARLLTLAAFTSDYVRLLQ